MVVLFTKGGGGLIMTLSQYFTKMSDICWIKDGKEYGERVVPLHDVLKVIAAIENRIGPLTIGEDEE